MKSVPERPPIDRTQPPYRDDPVIARLTDDEAWAVAELLARLATSYARRLEQSADDTERPSPPEPVRNPRTRRPSPARLAKWEAHWQAEQGER